jgi:hypothetical protein
MLCCVFISEEIYFDFLFLNPKKRRLDLWAFLSQQTSIAPSAQREETEAATPAANHTGAKNESRSWGREFFVFFLTLDSSGSTV